MPGRLNTSSTCFCLWKPLVRLTIEECLVAQSGTSSGSRLRINAPRPDGSRIIILSSPATDSAVISWLYSDGKKGCGFANPGLARSRAARKPLTMNLRRWLVCLSFLFVAPFIFPGFGATTTLLGWNDLGMHCMDADYSVFSILPPYNTIHAQVVSQDQLVSTDNDVSVTYEAVTDPSGSINRTSVGKSTFWQYAGRLYLPLGTPPLAADMGLAGFAMPGLQNVPQAMRFDAASGWFSAEGIPITPVDDAGQPNPYPMMRLVARDRTTGTLLARADVVLPVSEEMDCRACHASGTDTAAQPAAGWAWDCDAQRDYRWNILRLHDELNDGSPEYLKALKTAGYATTGLYDSAHGGTPVLCARCHASNALPGTGLAGLPPLTEAVHRLHAYVSDPATGQPLTAANSRAACYRCHPGSETRCLRGVMGNAVDASGSLAMGCQSCHGDMERVGSDNRRGWLDEPNCQNCHTGTATKNSGAIRFTSAFDDQGNPRAAADPTFATTADVPVAGASLFRFSQGHGGLYCSACHGSTHAEFPSADVNDNVYSQQIQGHVGMIAECTACHTATPTTTTGGPHGLHPLGSSWISRHDNATESNLNACKTCHGTDLRGTVLSRMLADRTLTAFGAKSWWRGFQVGCYNCHPGPSDDDATANRPAVVTSTSLTTPAGQSVSGTLTATDADNNTLTLRIVTQPQHGTVGLNNRVATYHPEPGYVGPDRFTFAAWDGSTDSNLGGVEVTVTPADCQLTLSVAVPAEVAVGATAPFRARSVRTGCNQPVTFEWTWGDGHAPATSPEICRSFPAAGEVTWEVRAVAGTASKTLTGVVTVGGPVVPVALAVARIGNDVQITWPSTSVGYRLESVPYLGVTVWQTVAQTPVVVNGQFTVTVPATTTEQYFRLRQGP